ncbi:MAG: sulfotransferase domain-containing protein [Candidatus Neomarinimicrobiota bacterium]
MSFLHNKGHSIFGEKLSFQVDFIVCGVQKGGTTALDQYLRLHPHICMADKKEVHFFDRDEYFNNFELDYSQYHKFFSPKKFHKIIGEATPIYSYWDLAIERIYKYNSKIKLILVLRNPVKRAFSHWNMERDRNREERSFWDSINAEKSKLFESNHIQDRTYSYLERGLYSSQIKKIYTYFKENQLLIIKNETLRKNPNLVLKKISSFLSIQDFDNIKHREVHSRIYPIEMSKNEAVFLKSFYKCEIEELENLLNQDFASWKE